MSWNIFVLRMICFGSREQELGMFIETRKENGSVKGDRSSIDAFCKWMEDNRINLEFQERISLEAVNALILRLREQLELFRVVADERAPWEEKSAAVRLANKTQKCKRNKLWRKRKRKQIAEKLAKVVKPYHAYILVS